MRIAVLIENTACRDDLAREHGLSLYVETGEYRILFDMGQSGVFAENAEKLGVDLTKVDFAVVSHGHYDHGGGLSRFLQINQTAPVYLGMDAFAPHFNAAGKNIGLNPTPHTDRLVFTGDHLEIAPGMELYSCNERHRPYPTDSWAMTFGEDRQAEDFRHEQYLLIRDNGKTVCISGCSHKGILNIVHWFRPDVLVGGFHLMKQTDIRVLEDTAHNLLAGNTVYYTGHCTGQPQFARLRQIMGQRLRDFSTGTVMEL